MDESETIPILFAYWVQLRPYWKNEDLHYYLYHSKIMCISFLLGCEFGKMIIPNLMKCTKDSIINTFLYLYCHKLQEIGCHAYMLPNPFGTPAFIPLCTHCVILAWLCSTYNHPSALPSIEEIRQYIFLKSNRISLANIAFVINTIFCLYFAAHEDRTSIIPFNIILHKIVPFIGL